jgi:hypothetical protein
MTKQEKTSPIAGNISGNSIEFIVFSFNVRCFVKYLHVETAVPKPTAEVTDAESARSRQQRQDVSSSGNTVARGSARGDTLRVSCSE